MRKLIAVVALCGCASQGAPPGGPPDTQAPKIVRITPDSGTTGVKGGSVIFRFDEVVSERPAGSTTLGDLFVVSPRQGVPNVAWHREEVRVKPRRGWLPNTTYTVTQLPGIGDLRGNVKNTRASTFFSTGTGIDEASISGSVYDLLSGAPAPDALIEARTGADTTVSWVSTADSLGAFRLAHLPVKPFSMRAYVDGNHNFGLDPDEPYDTATVSAGDSASAVFFLVVRDSVAPRLTSAVATDSVSISATFDRPSDSASALDPATYTVIGTDSAKIPILSVKLPPSDTTRARVKSNRPMPVVSVRITLATPLPEKKVFRLRATGIRGLLRQTLPTEIVIASPAASTAPGRRTPPPPPSNLPGGAVPIPIKHD
jgi:hypothetical protein